MNEQTTKFVETHDIRILDRNKRSQRYRPLNIKWFSNPNDYNQLTSEYLEYDTEPVYTIEIKLSELTKIAEFESEVFNHMKQRGHYDMFNWIMEQKEEEKYLKEKYPAVKTAYEHYSLMLKMAAAGEL